MLRLRDKRKSDEQIEIVAYILKNRSVDLKNLQEVKETVSWLNDEIKKRQFAHRHYGAKNTDKNYVYVLEQYQKLVECMG